MATTITIDGNNNKANYVVESAAGKISHQQAGNVVPAKYCNNYFWLHENPDKGFNVLNVITPTKACAWNVYPDNSVELDIEMKVTSFVPATATEKAYLIAKLLVDKALGSSEKWAGFTSVAISMGHNVANSPIPVFGAATSQCKIEFNEDSNNCATSINLVALMKAIVIDDATRSAFELMMASGYLVFDRPTDTMTMSQLAQPLYSDQSQQTLPLSHANLHA